MLKKELSGNESIDHESIKDKQDNDVLNMNDKMNIIPFSIDKLCQLNKK